jgi:hypothetical protein
MANFNEEEEIVERFLKLLGYQHFVLSNPNQKAGVETGSDVSVILDKKKYGIQVTILHTDEGASPSGGGSKTRRDEAKYKDSKVPYAIWGKANPMDALENRIREKCQKNYPAYDFDEVVLLVAASLPMQGAMGATLALEFVLDDFLQTHKMDLILSPILEGSRYDSVYIYNMMGVAGASVYKWLPNQGWKKSQEPAI